MCRGPHGSQLNVGGWGGQGPPPSAVPAQDAPGGRRSEPGRGVGNKADAFVSLSRVQASPRPEAGCALSGGPSGSSLPLTYGFSEGSSRHRCSSANSSSIVSQSGSHPATTFCPRPAWDCARATEAAAGPPPRRRTAAVSGGTSCVPGDTHAAFVCSGSGPWPPDGLAAACQQPAHQPSFFAFRLWGFIGFA